MSVGPEFRAYLLDDLPFEKRRVLAYGQQHAFIGYSECSRCGLPWAVVTERTVEIEDKGGCFAICRSCWNELGTADARIPYYIADRDRYHWNYSNYELTEAIKRESTS